MNVYLKNKLAGLLAEDGIGGKRLMDEVEKGYARKDSGYIEYLKEELDIEVIAFDEEEYPLKLREINDYPVLLFVKGNKELLKMNIFTIVGTRQMSRYGSNVIEDLLDYDRNICIASGLARGVDAEVHRVCLNRCIPTIAVTAGGFFDGYPKSNEYLFKRICDTGLVISEFPPGRELIKGMFPMRNRILAGIGCGVLVVESGIKGGSMITANFALEYGREVSAVPGDIFSEQSSGCNYLISQGAGMITGKGSFYSLFNNDNIAGAQ